MHLKDPSRFWQVPGEQVPGKLTHSLISVKNRGNVKKKKTIQVSFLISNTARVFHTRTNAVLPVCRVLVALVAEALEGAQSVDALTVPAHLPLEGAALVDI